MFVLLAALFDLALAGPVRHRDHMRNLMFGRSYNESSVSLSSITTSTTSTISSQESSLSVSFSITPPVPSNGLDAVSLAFPTDTVASGQVGSVPAIPIGHGLSTIPTNPIFAATDSSASSSSSTSVGLVALLTTTTSSTSIFVTIPTSQPTPNSPTPVQSLASSTSPVSIASPASFSRLFTLGTGFSDEQFPTSTLPEIAPQPTTTPEVFTTTVAIAPLDISATSAQSNDPIASNDVATFGASPTLVPSSVTTALGTFGTAVATPIGSSVLASNSDQSTITILSTEVVTSTVLLPSTLVASTFPLSTLSPTTPTSAPVIPNAQSGNIALALAFNSVFDTLTTESTCTPASGNQFACVNKQLAQCGSDGKYKLLECAQGERCYALPLPGNNEGIKIQCDQPTDAKVKLGLNTSPDASGATTLPASSPTALSPSSPAQNSPVSGQFPSESTVLATATVAADATVTAVSVVSVTLSPTEEPAAIATTVVIAFTTVAPSTPEPTNQPQEPAPQSSSQILQGPSQASDLPSQAPTQVASQAPQVSQQSPAPALASTPLSPAQVTPQTFVQPTPPSSISLPTTTFAAPGMTIVPVEAKGGVTVTETVTVTVTGSVN
ncbi:hypothetical protein MMC24_001955 [Lignoscripta atroalba]|nr:hypothetical protein [Lignoscripta atroalba]